MQHFDITEWSDQVRGLAEPSIDALMQSHLEVGCDECGGIVSFLGDIAGTAEADLEMSPPEFAVRGAKASFAATWSKSPSRLEVLTANIFFDSAFDPLPAGARSLDTYSRHILCQADDYYVDCKMDYDQESRNVILVGQVLHGESALKEVPVFFISDDRVVVSGTNQFGEFESTCHQAPLTLRLMVSEGKCLEVKVDLRQVGEGLSSATTGSALEKGRQDREGFFNGESLDSSESIEFSRQPSDRTSETLDPLVSEDPEDEESSDV